MFGLIPLPGPVAPGAMPARWRQLAEDQRALGADAQASTLEWCASELERALDSLDSELVTISEAADMGGYSEEHLRRLVRERTLPAVQASPGRRIWLRVRDVPMKPTTAVNRRRGVSARVAGRNGGTYDPVEDARDIAQAIGGER